LKRILALLLAALLAGCTGASSKPKTAPPPKAPQRLYWTDASAPPVKVSADLTLLVLLPRQDTGLYDPKTTEADVRAWLAAGRRAAGGVPWLAYYWTTNNVEHARWFTKAGASIFWERYGWLVAHAAEYGCIGLLMDAEDYAQGHPKSGWTLAWTHSDATAKQLRAASGTLLIGFMVPGAAVDSSARFRKWVEVLSPDLQLGEEYAVGPYRLVPASRYYRGIRPKDAAKTQPPFWVYNGP
jgi:hypothetical protein